MHDTEGDAHESRPAAAPAHRDAERSRALARWRRYRINRHSFAEHAHERAHRRPRTHFARSRYPRNWTSDYWNGGGNYRPGGWGEGGYWRPGVGWDSGGWNN